MPKNRILKSRPIKGQPTAFRIFRLSWILAIGFWLCGEDVQTRSFAREAPNRSGTSAADRLADHIRMLESVHDHWHRVAEAVENDASLPDRTQGLASDRLPAPWDRRTAEIREQAEEGETGSMLWERARWLASVEANELAVVAYQAAQMGGDDVRVADRRQIHTDVRGALVHGEHQGLLVEDRRALAVALFELQRYTEARQVLKPVLDVDLVPTSPG